MSDQAKDMLSNDEKSDTPYGKGKQYLNVVEFHEEEFSWGDGLIFRNKQDSINWQARSEDGLRFDNYPENFVQYADGMIQEVVILDESQSPLPAVNEVDQTQIRVDQTQRTFGNSQKNIAGNVVKSSIKIMFKIYKKKLKDMCLKLRVSYKHFKKYYSKTFFKKVYGPESLYEEFFTNRQHQDWKKIFMTFFRKVVRKHYAISAVKTGKMKEIKQDYFRLNKQILLYFPVSVGIKNPDT